MELFLKWKDGKGNVYHLGTLSKTNHYYFYIHFEELKKATHNGCAGIGSIDLSEEVHESLELFPFFLRRIPSKKNKNILSILEKYQLNEYDEMELLRHTKARILTDRYYIEDGNQHN